MTGQTTLAPTGLRALLVATGGLAWTGPWLPPRARATLDLAFSPICHQRAERTLVLAGHAMSVCSRCAGVYAGIVLGALFAWPTLGRARWTTSGFVAGLLLALDVVTQDLQIHPLWHATRLFTGALCGYAASAWMVQETRRKVTR